MSKKYKNFVGFLKKPDQYKRFYKNLLQKVKISLKY